MTGTHTRTRIADDTAFGMQLKKRVYASTVAMRFRLCTDRLHRTIYIVYVFRCYID